MFVGSDNISQAWKTEIQGKVKGKLIRDPRKQLKENFWKVKVSWVRRRILKVYNSRNWVSGKEGVSMDPLPHIAPNNSGHHNTRSEINPNPEKKGKVSNGMKKRVKEIAEKLKMLGVEERLELESIQSLLSALEPAAVSLPPSSGLFGLLNHCYNFLSSASRKYFSFHWSRKISKSNLYCLFFSFLALIFYFELHTSSGFTRFWLKWEDVDLRSVECTIESPNVAMELFRPPVPCVFCQNVKVAHRVSNISPSDFEHKYAYSGRPVVIIDAMVNWTATDTFTFSFLKSIYGKGSRSLEHLGEDCLFFPYSTEFRSLAEVFNMSQDRSLQPWYIGWSNCDAATSHILRQHYERPYFLPTTAESTHADWIFMGTPDGPGAHMHIDHVINPSWQAQIRGKKRWILQPPPECFYQCQSFHVDVGPGEIIVLDTNKWYHQTAILPGDMSITIGSEYD